MSYLYVTFTDSQTAIKALDRIWKNYLLECQAKGYEIVDFAGNKVDDLSDHNGYNLRILPDKGDKAFPTTKYNSTSKAYEQDIWYFVLPPENLMAGVDGYELMEFDESWTPPDLSDDEWKNNPSYRSP